MLLEQAGLRTSDHAPPRPDGSSQELEVHELYRRLDGGQERPTFRPGPWDLRFSGLIVELDEELHFNRYRAQTLETSWSRDLPWAETYRAQCARYEPECLRAGRWGKRWTNASAARMFEGGPAGDLEGAGAPRWKQRALYDAIKDTAVGDVTLARVSVWDALECGRLLGEVLDGVAVEPREVLDHVEQRRAPPLRRRA